MSAPPRTTTRTSSMPGGGTLFFAAGPGDEQHGRYGRIDVVPGEDGTRVGRQWQGLASAEMLRFFFEHGRRAAH